VGIFLVFAFIYAVLLNIWSIIKIAKSSYPAGYSIFCFPKFIFMEMLLLPQNLWLVLAIFISSAIIYKLTKNKSLKKTHSVFINTNMEYFYSSICLWKNF